MSILDNLEAYLEFKDTNHTSLQTKIFSDTVCMNCSEKESTPMSTTDNMGRDTSMYYQG